MSSYDETLEAIKTKLLDLLKKSETQNSSEPLTHSLLNNLKNIVIDYDKKLTQIASKEKPHKLDYASQFKSLSKEYSQKEKKLEEKLRQSTKEITNKYDLKCKELKEEIKEKEREIHFEENNILMDIEFFIMASNQNKEMFEAEYNENISRFNYQVQIASDSYSENTIRFNEALDKEIEKLTQKYNNSLVDYDKDTERIIQHYQKNVDDLNSVLAKKIDEFNKYQAQTRQKKVKESMEFNDKIRALVSIRNEKNQSARNEYIQKQEEAQENKDSKRQEYQMESQKISKEFVLNMTSLDDRIAKLKKDYNSTLEKEKVALEYRLLELKKEEEKLLTELYATSSFKKYARKIKSEYYGYQELERKNTNKALSHLEKAYLVDTEKTNYQKKLLDIDRTFNMKYIVENETYDNKKFQEINNKFEIDMNHSIQINDLDYNREANKLRSENNIQTLKEEKDYDEADALHQIETEKLICQIKSIKYEIASFEEIKKLLHKFETDKYNTTINFKTVNNVLEIEKCKVLDTLNKSMYDLNIKSSKMVLDTSNKAIDLKNQEYEQKCRAKIKRNRMVLNTEQKLIDYQIECYKRDKALELSILNRNFFFELDTLGHDFLALKFKFEYKIMMSNLAILTEIITLIHYMETNLINSIFNSIPLRPEYKAIAWPFINELLSIIFLGYQRIISIFHQSIDDMIHERIEFEESLKYKGFYRNIEANYKDELKIFVEKRKIYEKQVADLSEDIEGNKRILFSLDNDLYIKRKNIKKMGSNNKKEKQEIIDTINQYHTIENENIALSKRLLVLQKEIARVDNQIAQVNLSYARQQDEIKKMQITNAQSYFELEKTLERHISSSIASMNLRLREQDISDSEFQNSLYLIKERDNYFNQLSEYFLVGLYSLMNRFSDDEQDAIIKSAEILEAGYKTDLSEIDRDDKSERANAKANYAREDEQRQEEIMKFDRDTQNEAASLKQAILNHDALVKKLSLNIQDEMAKANQIFYSDYYAICDNQKDVIDKQASDIKNLELEYKKNRVIIFDRFKKSKLQLKSMLEEYIVSRNEILQHLPIAEKENEKAFRDDDRKKNIEIEENYVNIKTKSSTSLKEVLKNMDLIKSAFDSKQSEIEHDYKMSKLKEKRIHRSQLRKIG